MKKPLETYLLVLLLLMVGSNALVAGFGLMILPDGRWIGLPLSWLQHTPFDSFLIPGVLLWVFVGLLPLLSGCGLLFDINWKWPERLNIFPDKSWAWTFSLYSGITMCIWIVVQQMITAFFFLQPIIAGAGLLITILTLSPRIARRFTHS